MKIKDILKLLRINHWYKNILILIPLIFSRFLLKTNPLQIIFAILSFSLMSSSVYILNDIKDAEKDKLHPKKKNRPIAKGIISKRNAYFISFILANLSIILSEYISKGSSLILLIYLLNNLIYTYFLKKIIFLDLISLSFGFMLRIFYGCYIFKIKPSIWLILIVFFLSLYLSTAKRIANCVLKQCRFKFYFENREILLNFEILSIIISYIMYLLEKNNPILHISIIFVIFGILRHKELTNKGLELHEMFKDLILLLVGIAYIINIIIALYF